MKEEKKRLLHTTHRICCIFFLCSFRCSLTLTIDRMRSNQLVVLCVRLIALRCGFLLKNRARFVCLQMLSVCRVRLYMCECVYVFDDVYMN